MIFIFIELGNLLINLAHQEQAKRQILFGKKLYGITSLCFFIVLEKKIYCYIGVRLVLMKKYNFCLQILIKLVVSKFLVMKADIL
jgi:hypothetical protein